MSEQQLPRTAQEYYDLLVKSAYDGTFPSREGTRCLYRRDQTAACPQRCAAGLLLPDERYEPGLEGKSPRAICELLVLPADVSMEDVARVQVEHDYTDPWDGDRFVRAINKVPCFIGCVWKEVNS